MFFATIISNKRERLAANINSSENLCCNIYFSVFNLNNWVLIAFNSAFYTIFSFFMILFVDKKRVQ